MATFSVERKAQIADVVRRYCEGEQATVLATELGMHKANLNYHLRQARAPRRSETCRAMVPCAYCGKEFKAFHKRRRVVKFCSQLCVAAASSVRQTLTGPTIQDGYRHILVPVGHPSRQSTRRFNRRTAEHVVIAEGVLGRPLKRGEVVHHINGNSLDNRNSNLLVCTQAYHAQTHARMSRLYQQEKFGGAV